MAARSPFRPLRSVPRVIANLAHPILRGQSCWFVANGQNRNVRDIINRNGYAPGALNATVSFGGTQYGQAWRGDGSATSYLDLGASNRFIAGDAQPFTIMWVEWHTGATALHGVVNLIPGGGSTTPFAILRGSSSSIGSGANYGCLSFGPWKASGTLSGCVAGATTGPPALNQNSQLVIIITGAAGPVSQTPGDWTIYWFGNPTNLVPNATRGDAPAVTSGNTGALGATANYFGWDNADAKFTGLLDNLRIWNRVLNPAEIQGLLVDPYLGDLRTARLASPLINLNVFRPWMPMPTGWLS